MRSDRESSLGSDRCWQQQCGRRGNHRITAGEGKLVLAGLAAPGNGHVAVVVDYRNAFDSYPAPDRNKAVASWGQLHSVGQEYTRITKAGKADELDKVLYAYAAIP